MQSLISPETHTSMPQCGSAIRSVARLLRSPAQRIPFSNSAPRPDTCDASSILTGNIDCEWFVGAIDFEIMGQFARIPASVKR